MSESLHTTRSLTALPSDTSAGCPAVLDRRRFVLDAASAIGAALLAGGLVSTRAFASGVGEVAALAVGKIERSYALPAVDGVWVDVENRVCLVRTSRQLFAFSLECPHKGRLLEWTPAENRFYCPKHKVRFLTDGSRASGRRTPDLDRFALRLQQDRVIVAVDRVLAADVAPTEWAAAVLRV